MLRPSSPGSAGSGRHRRRPALAGRPGRVTLLGILASLVVMLGSGVGLTLTATAPSASAPEPPGLVTALGTAPAVTAAPSLTATTAPSPTATPSPEPPPPPPDPEPEPEPPPAEAEVDELTAIEDEVTALTNAERAAAGCPALGTDERLRDAARGHSQDMAVNDYFDHTSLDGRSPFERMADAGYPDPAAENIAFGYRTPADVMDGWMDSEGHRTNILNCSYQALGVGVGFDPGGRPYWTQNFGR